MAQSIRSRTLFIASILIVIGFGGGAYFFWQRWTSLPGPGSAKYLEYQRAFQVGIAAMDVGEHERERAIQNLEQATALIPEEPAGWANLGLIHLRNNQLTEAATNLKRARDLAPKGREIESILGYLAEKQGRQPEAVAHFRKAVQGQDQSNDLRSLYTLADAVSREGGDDSQAEYQRLLEQILKAQPNNLAVLGEHAAAAFRNQDKVAFRDTVDRLARLASNWKTGSPKEPGAREMLDELRKAAENDPREVPHLVVSFNNVLRAERGYQRDKAAIRPDAAFVGAPIRHFLRLQPVRPTPAPPDRALTFKIELQPAPSLAAPEHEKKTWDVIRPMWLMSAEQISPLTNQGDKGGHRLWPADGYKLTLVLANAQEVRRADADTPVLPFPSGPMSVAPTPAGVLVVDWNGDYRPDLLLAGAAGLRFWQQRPDGAFADVSAKTGLPAGILSGDYYGAWAADADTDGDLDLIVARRSGSTLLLRNNGDGTFKSLDTFADVRDVRALVWIDLDNDGLADAAFLDAKGKLHVLSNERHGQFSPWPLPQDLGAVAAITGADVNDDGVFDLIVLRSDGTLVRVSDQNQKQAWQIVELARIPEFANAEPGSVTLFAEDLDNNGAIDLIVGGPSSAQVFLAGEKGAFAPLPEAIPLRLGAVLDLHRDGRLDPVGLSDDGKPMRALNQSKKAYRWQTVWPIANPRPDNQDGRINSFGIGGEVEVRSGPLVQKQPINGPAIHFGLGDQPAVDVARIVWPNGLPQTEFDMPSFRFIAAVQRLYASCPFLFTYDGTGMRFAGDFMWGTPLGMYVNGQNIGDFPQTTEWLKIRGEHLVPRDGHYDVRVHANLWEADYFDQLALIAVDHPADTEIHVDERFYLTPTAPKMYVTSPAKPIAHALDHHGKDANDEVRAIDGRYLDRAGRGRFQGITNDHWVEVDLGNDSPKEGPLLLIARGWLQPTNSSINVAIAQGKHDAPRPLSLEIPDGKGGWRVALPALGFPAGKDKTMLIRLDGIDGKGVCRRFRLRTNMEIYWDYLGYAIEQDPKSARLQRPTPLSADLRYCGVLQMTRKNESSPEVPNYDRVTRSGQPWRDLTGYYTRFGDVRELLAKVDDRYAILNAGDEIALRYPVPDGPPSGWKRDFIWECDGWTRDGDLNTKFGNSVLPLPAHGVKTEERPPSRLEDDPVFRRFPRDWQTFHTRYVTGEEFARGLRR